MKPLPIVLAALLAVPLKAEEPPKMTMIEGVCAGVVIGFLGGMSIYLVWKCANLVPPPNQDNTNPPPVWIYPPPPPPPDTNNVVTNSVHQIPVLQAGNSGVRVGLGPNVTGCFTTLQGSDDLQQWETIAHVQGYVEGTNQWFIACDTNWQAIAAGSSLFLQSSNRFYRTVRTP